MRKWLLVLLTLVILFLAGVYIFIPSKLTIKKFESVYCAPNAIQRVINDKSKTRRWWPAKADSSKRLFYKDYEYEFLRPVVNGFVISLRNEQVNTQGAILILPLGNDSSVLTWKTEFETAGNPFKKIGQYRQAVDIKNSMADILRSLKTYAEKQENVYGMRIQQTTVTDLLLASTKSITNSPPTTEDIYKMVATLRNYARIHGANETNPPMLNVKGVSDNKYETKVAIPVDIVLPENSNIAFKRMVPGNILVGEVKGGTHTANEALRQLENYVRDHGRESPAIPFQSLVTDRSKEQDTTKWITRVYYPIL